MSATFRPSLVIGVGGAGQRVLLELKKNLLDATGGKMPDAVHLLAFDTGNPDINERIPDISLDQSEFVSVGRPLWRLVRDIADGKYEHIGTWFSPDTAKFLLKSMPEVSLNRGPGTLRLLSRLALVASLESYNNPVTVRIEGILRNIAQTTADEITVFIVGSLEGSTGSTLCIDLAVLIRGILNRTIKKRRSIINAILMLPSSLSHQSHDTYENALAAWREIDRLLQITPSRPVQFTYTSHESITLSEPLYDAVYLVARRLGTTTDATLDTFPMIADYIRVSLDSSDSIIRTLIGQATDQNTSGPSAPYRSLRIYTVKAASEALRQLYLVQYAITIIDTLIGASRETPSGEQASSTLLNGLESTEGLDLVASSVRQAYRYREENIGEMTSIIVAENYLPLMKWLPRGAVLDEIFGGRPDVFSSIDRVESSGERTFAAQFEEVWNNVYGLGDQSKSTGDYDRWLSKVTYYLAEQARKGLESLVLQQLKGALLAPTDVRRQLDEIMTALNRTRTILRDYQRIMIERLDSTRRDYQGTVDALTSRRTLFGFLRGQHRDQRRLVTAARKLCIAQESSAEAQALDSLLYSITEYLDLLNRRLHSWNGGLRAIFTELRAIEGQLIHRIRAETRVVCRHIVQSPTLLPGDQALIRRGIENIEWTSQALLFHLSDTSEAIYLPLTLADASSRTIANKAKELTRWAEETLGDQHPAFDLPALLARTPLSVDIIPEIRQQHDNAAIYSDRFRRDNSWVICVPKQLGIVEQDQFEALVTNALGTGKSDKVYLAGNDVSSVIQIDSNLRKTYFEEWGYLAYMGIRDVANRLSVGQGIQHVLPNEQLALQWEIRLAKGTRYAMLSDHLIGVMADAARFHLFFQALFCGLIGFEPQTGYVLKLPGETVFVSLTEPTSVRSLNTEIRSSSAMRFEEFLNALFQFVSAGVDIRTSRNPIDFPRVAYVVEKNARLQFPTRESVEQLLRLAMGPISEVEQTDLLLAHEQLYAIAMTAYTEWQGIREEALRQEWGVRDAVEYIENFYVAGPPLRPTVGRLFVGRKRTFQNIERAFRNPLEKSPVVLYGQRRMGKTSVLYHIQSRLGQAFIPVMIDLQGLAVEIQREEHLWAGVARRIRTDLMRAGFPEASLLTEQEVTTPFMMGDFLVRVESLLGKDQWLVLMFDEFEKLEEKIDSGIVGTDFLNYLRSIMQHKPQFLIILAGHHTLQERMRDYWGPLMGVAKVEHLSYLTEAESRELITNPWDGFSLSYTADAVDELIFACGGQPMLLQLACHNILAGINEQLDATGPQINPTATIEDVSHVLDTMAAEADNEAAYYFDAVWDWLNSEEKLLIVRCANSANMKSASFDVDGFTSHEVELLDRLVDRDVFAKQDDRFRFKVPLLMRWLPRNGER